MDGNAVVGKVFFLVNTSGMARIDKEVTAEGCRTTEYRYKVIQRDSFVGWIGKIHVGRGEIIVEFGVEYTVSGIKSNNHVVARCLCQKIACALYAVRVEIGFVNFQCLHL